MNVPTQLQIIAAPGDGALIRRRAGSNAVRYLRARWQRHRQLADTARVLGTLNGRMLRDIGLDPSEVRSAVAELYGDADPADVRTRTLWHRHY